MNCKKCGSQLTNEDQFCQSCGAALNDTSASNSETIGSSKIQQPIINNASEESVNNINSQSMSNQSSWKNGYNTQPTYNKILQKNNDNTKFIIIGVIVAIAIIVAMVFIEIMNNNENDLSNNKLNSNSAQVSNSVYKVNFKGFTFNIPDHFVYEEDDGALLIGDELGTWIVMLELEQGNFSQLQATKSQLQGTMQRSGYTSTAAVEKTLGGVNFITLEITASGQNAIAALAKANSMYFVAITVYNQDNDYDYLLLEKVAPIISSLSYTGEANNIKSNIKLDLTGITDLAK